MAGLSMEEASLMVAVASVEGMGQVIGVMNTEMH